MFAFFLPPAAAQVHVLREHGQIGGWSWSVACAGSYAYLGVGPNFTILDISNPSAPVRVGQLRLPELIGGIQVVNNVAYVTAEGAGLFCIDVSNPAQPQIIGSLNLGRGVWNLSVANNMAYLASGAAGVFVVDVGNPTQPRLRGACDTAGNANGVYVAGTRCYVADGGWLRILNVANPSSPTTQGSIRTAGVGRKVFVSGTTAYVADGSYWTGSTMVGGLAIINVANASSPTTLCNYRLPGNAVAVRVSNNIAYVADQFGGLRIVNVSNPSSPTLLGASAPLDGPEDVFVHSGLVYVASSRGGLHILHVATPSNPIIRSNYRPAPIGANSVVVNNNLAYVGDWGSRLHILDVTDPALPTVRCSYDVGGSAGDLFVAGTTAYVSTFENGLKIVNVSNPSSPTLRCAYRTYGDAVNVQVVGNLAYVLNQGWGNTWKGLQILNVSNPSSPTVRGSVALTQSPYALHVVGTTAYIANGTSGVVTVNVANPASPAIRGRTRGLTSSLDVTVLGTWAYVANGNWGVAVLDVSQPSSPTLRHRYPTPGYAKGVFHSGSLLYVACDTAGVVVLDASNPTSLTLRATGRTTGAEAENVFVQRGMVYVAVNGGGFWIMEYGNGAPRIQNATYNDTNVSETIDAGDQLVLTLDRSVLVATQILRASHFFLPVAGDSLGGAGFAVEVNPRNSRQIAITLGTGARLKPAGQFSILQRGNNSPSGIDFATSLPTNAIVSRLGIPATDGGLVGVDDSGVDVEYNLIPRVMAIGPGGGSIAAVVSPDAAYTQHRLSIGPNALGSTFTFSLLPPARNLGAINAVKVSANAPLVPFLTPATLRLQYREGDVDRERGFLESEIKVHQLYDAMVGLPTWRILPGVHTLNTAARTVSANISALRAPSTLPSPSAEGETGIFAGLPIETVDERSVIMKPGSGIGPSAGSVVLTPGPLGAYTLHKLEFPNYVTTTAADPAAIHVTIRTATLAERYSYSGGQSFPMQSGAIFVVAVLNAQYQPIPFTAPVHITVQFKNRTDPTQTDVVKFNSQVSQPAMMRLACDQAPNEALDFGFITASNQVVNTAQGTVAVQNYIGLAGADGLGIFGAVAMHTATPVAHWELYR